MYGMALFVQFMFFIALIRILHIAKSPILCASIYTFIVFFFGVISGERFLYIIFNSGIVLGLSFVYYWLLLRYEGYFIYWIILILGLLILFL